MMHKYGNLRNSAIALLLSTCAGLANAQAINPANSVQVLERGRLSSADPRTAAEHQLKVFKGGPAVTIRATPDWYRVRLSAESSVTVSGKGFLSDRVLLRKGDSELISPLIATIDGVDHVLVRSLIFDTGSGWSKLQYLPSAIGDSKSYYSGWVLVDAATGTVSSIPVTYRTTDNLFGESTWSFLKPKGDEALGTVALEIYGDESAVADLAAAELEKVQQIGSRICSPSAAFWKQRGFTEGISPDNGKIKISVSDGEDEGKVIWSDPAEWQACE